MEEAKNLLKDAEIHQEECQHSALRTRMLARIAKRNARLAARQAKEADLAMGRTIYFLRQRGFPVNICGDSHHLLFDTSALSYTSFSPPSTHQFLSEKEATYVPGHGYLKLML